MANVVDERVRLADKKVERMRVRYQMADEIMRKAKRELKKAQQERDELHDLMDEEERASA